MVALCALADLKVDVQQENQTLDDTVLARCIADASDSFQRAIGRAIQQTAPASNQIRRGADVRWGTERLLVNLPTPRIQAVSALSYRLGTPAVAWTAVDATLLDWETSPPASEISSLIRVYLPGGASRNDPLWVRISYTAGWLCDFAPGAATDLPPADLQAIVRWWAAWYYRKKDAPFERTANPLTGAVTIPREMPGDLLAGVVRWRGAWIA